MAIFTVCLGLYRGNVIFDRVNDFFCIVEKMIERWLYRMLIFTKRRVGAGENLQFMHYKMIE